MEKVDEFFQEMKQLFLEKDLEAFEEIKEDMTEHIQIKITEGEDIENILEQLGSPKSIVDAFYEDKRLEKVKNYETDVVAIEDVRLVAIQEEKDKLYKWYSRGKKSVKHILKCLFIVLVALSAICLIWTFIAYQHVSVIFLLILGNSLFGLNLLKDLQKKSIRSMSFFTLIFVMVSFFIMYCIHFKLFFYQGEKIDEMIELDSHSLESLTLTGDFPINLTIEETENAQPKMEVNGRLLKSVKKEIESLKGKTDQSSIDFGQKSVISYFSAMGDLDVTLYVPKTIEKSFVLEFDHADVQGSDLTVKNLDMTLGDGEVTLEEVEGQHFRLNSQRADLFIDDFDTPLEIDNSYGKSIIKNGKGNVVLNSTSGFSNILNVQGDKFTFNNSNGKIIMSETKIAQLDIKSDSNTVIVENQLGDTNINIKDGKLVLKENKGTLSIKNQAAPIIVTQHVALEGEIDNERGLIKWVQYAERKSQVPKFNINSPTKQVRNDFSNQGSNHSEKEFTINNKTGKVEMIKK